ncbi:nitronate monooxygenase [Clostridium ganghwense]|uniref:Probable nitronate monooxygenase n=1 Tax=Clostridium ganghwense TaxID=312089 RepID=A0ABT4CRF0_9CLOT|nr:nitronate monooxygenase [Clostridium ganghwense]MCY6371622.1 nitronate monooxygenase [Clostridium ganghwense]
MKTKLTELLNIKYPIIQGAMAWVSESNLTAAVSNAGGAGTIASGGRTAEWVKEEIQKTKKLTNKSFGVNIAIIEGNCDEIIKVICEARVAYVTTGAGNPIPYFEKLHKAGIKVIPVVPNLKLAKRVAEKGADAVIIEGMESGGHIGTISSMALMTQVIPQVDIPVIAAGGFSDGRGLAAALTMGAAGVQIGTRFYASKECTAHIDVKQRIVDAIDTDTVVTGKSIGHRVRTLSNKLSDKYLELEKNGVSEEELINLVTGTSQKAPQEGDVEFGSVYAGQSITVIDKIESCQSIIEKIITDAKEAIQYTQKYI